MTAPSEGLVYPTGAASGVGTNGNALSACCHRGCWHRAGNDPSAVGVGAWLASIEAISAEVFPIGVPVKRLPTTEESLVLRTDFSTDSGWESVCEAISAPVGEFQAQLSQISDPAFDGLTIDRLLKLKHGDHGYVFIVDRVTLADPDMPVLVVDLEDEPGRSFRVVPSQMWSVENNLSLANMDFAEFAESADEHGVFRGFAGST